MPCSFLQENCKIVSLSHQLEILNMIWQSSCKNHPAPELWILASYCLRSLALSEAVKCHAVCVRECMCVCSVLLFDILPGRSWLTLNQAERIPPVPSLQISIQPSCITPVAVTQKCESSHKAFVYPRHPVQQSYAWSLTVKHC